MTMLLKDGVTGKEKKDIPKEKIGDVFVRINVQFTELSAILREMKSVRRNAGKFRESSDPVADSGLRSVPLAQGRANKSQWLFAEAGN
jgi:hypothetical protein